MSVKSKFTRYFRRFSAARGEANNKAILAGVAILAVGVGAFMVMNQKGGDDFSKNFYKLYPESSVMVSHADMGQEYSQYFSQYFSGVFSKPENVTDPRAMAAASQASPFYQKLFDKDFDRLFKTSYSIGIWPEIPGKGDGAKKTSAVPADSGFQLVANPAQPHTARPPMTVQQAPNPQTAPGQPVPPNAPGMPGAGPMGPGMAIPPQAMPQPTVMHVMMALPTEEKITLEDVKKSLDDMAAKTREEQYEGYTLVVAPDNQGAMTLVDDKLWVGDTVESLKQAIAHEKTKGNKSLLDDPNVTKALSKLPGNRQGTFVISFENLKETNPMLNGQVSAQDPRQEQSVKAFQELVSTIPVAVGSVSIDENNKGKTESGSAEEFDKVEGMVYIPVQLEKMQQEKMKEVLNGLVKTPPMQFKGASQLPADTDMVLSFSQLDDVLRTWIDLQKTNNPNNQFVFLEQMSGLMGLDFNKDVLGLFDGEFTLGVHHMPSKQPPQQLPGQPPVALTPEQQPNGMMVLFSKTDAKTATLDKLIKVISMQMQPGMVKKQQIGNATGTILDPGPKSKEKPFGYVALDNVLAFGNPEELNEMAKVQSNSAKNLTNNEMYNELTEGIPDAGYWFMYLNNPAVMTQADKAPKLLEAMAIAVGPAGDKSGVEGRFALKLIDSPNAKLADNGETAPATTEKTPSAEKAAPAAKATPAAKH